MDDSFEVSALDGSFHKEQAVSSLYQYNNCPYESSLKQNLVRHKHVKHPAVPVGTMSSQAVWFILNWTRKWQIKSNAIGFCVC